MKKSRVLFVGVFLLSYHSLNSSEPDEWCGPRERVFLKNWSINLNIGYTSYFGDLSQYDLDVVNKLIYESKPAYGIKLTKYIKNKFLMSGQFIYGGFKSDFLSDHIFETTLVEYSIQAGLDLTKLLFPRISLDYGFEVYVGTGQFIFQTNVFTGIDGLQTPKTNSTRVPEFVYFFGSGFYYQLSDRFRITVDLAIRQAQNDNIDKYLAHGDFDYYSLLNIGLSYAIGKIVSHNKYKSRFLLNKNRQIWRSNSM
ncbi:MAG: hypothetical protein JW731_11555 [Bacteroidales bacterium]|nr:hypothetical protein [Bacteroidales bacterium]